ncbi:uncharacterized protein Z520_08853 [Fonsecaea multimorphosa CBS 102226]|uniref:TauD/TfdA-like domain-containing protein n=1 Tax=Fonsecaea multimorphosa CBS 102226 TaxID=1442371 RepID=A0A0D2IDW9_9EURO|nr:uncharacterized protein Z520_08853 [Fonsecaea multimorphosa CBS 102226]KIX95336.1 hypothetical protein Z520_08853 [Fonsecaea multimorphosa CBS 102226]
MSPAALTPEPSFQVLPLVKRKDQKLNFGAIVEGLDLNHISDDDVKQLKETIWTHKVIIVRGQKDLTPEKHWELVTRFDPDASQVHSHGNLETFQKKGGMLSKSRDVYGIPGAENVRLVGKGYQGEDHYGLKNLNVKGLSNDFHADPPDDKDFQEGFTRFQRWHIDAPLYARDPAWFTTLRAVKLPSGPEVTIRWDDGSGLSMKAPPGLTAFFSTSQLYDMLSDDEKQLADHSWVEYAPYPYMWIENCKAPSTGLGLKSEGKEHTIEELGEYDEKDIKRYPFVWLNPVTGEKAFQVHGLAARKLFLRSSLDEQPKVIDKVEDIRAFLHNIQSRVLRPEYIWLPEIQEGDIVMWDNYGMFHTAVDYPLKYGPRSMHQANIGASKGPVGPVPIPTSVC